MERIEWDLLGTLQNIAKESSPILLEKIKKELLPAELKLLEHVWRKYYQPDSSAGRWYDIYHVPLVVWFSIQLRRIQPEISPLIVPASVGHDIGYFSVDKAQWKDPKIRISHMQEGAAAFAEDLVEVGEWTGREIGKIVGLVATHDNAYVGIPTKDPDRLALADADRAFVMHPISFWKDWLANEGFSPLELFRSRLTSFYAWPEAEKEKVTSEEKIHSQQMLEPFTKLARDWRDVQFAAREQEIQDEIWKNEALFRKYIGQHIRSELSAGRA